MEASPTYEPLSQHPSATRLMNAQPDAVLCRLAARGNVGAYDALYQRYRQPVYAFVFHLLGRANGNEDAEDITQDTFTRAFAGIRNQSVDGSFRAWLYTIARNRTYDVVRGGRQKVVSLDAEHAEPPVAPQAKEPAEQAEQRAEFAWLMTAVADLPERQREALLLREMGGFSHERIAEELGTSVSATKKLISRGRDGVGVAAASVGYRRLSRRRLGHDLAMAAPIVPISITLASLGVTGGVAAGGAAAGSAIAGGSTMIGGKAAATALTFLAIGGGAVAVEHDSSKDIRPAAVEQHQAVAGPVRSDNAARQLEAGRPGPPAGVHGGRRPGDGSRARDESSYGPGSGGSDFGGRDNSGPRRSGGERSGGDDSPTPNGDDHSGRSPRGDNSGPSNSGSDSGSGSDDAVESGETTTPSSGDDGGSSQSGKGSGDGTDSGTSGSDTSGPGTDGGSGSGDLLK